MRPSTIAALLLIAACDTASTLDAPAAGLPQAGVVSAEMPPSAGAADRTAAGSGGAREQAGADADGGPAAEICELAPFETWRPMDNRRAPHPVQPVAAWSEQRMRVLDLADFSVHAFDPCTNRWDRTLEPAPQLAQMARMAKRVRFTGTHFHIELPGAQGTALSFDPVSGAARMLGPVTPASDIVPDGALDPVTHSWNTLDDGHYQLFWSGATQSEQREVLSLSTLGFYFDFEATRWSAIAHSGAPAPRYQAALARHDTALAVFGGFAQLGVPWVETAEPVSDGGIYDLATERWTPIASKGAPTQCDGNKLASYSGCMRAVFNGRQLLAFSPANANNGVFSGGIYALDTQSWRALSDPPFTLVDSGADYLTTDDRLLHVQGASELGRAQLALLDLAHNGWRELQPAVPASPTLPAGGTPAGFIEVWTGRTLIRWRQVFSISRSCAQAPPGVGCDPVPEAPVVDATLGYMLTLSERPSEAPTLR